jgi:hypothetical protein
MIASIVVSIAQVVGNSNGNVTPTKQKKKRFNTSESSDLIFRTLFSQFSLTSHPLIRQPSQHCIRESVFKIEQKGQTRRRREFLALTHPVEVPQFFHPAARK